MDQIGPVLLHFSGPAWPAKPGQIGLVHFRPLFYKPGPAHQAIKYQSIPSAEKCSKTISHTLMEKNVPPLNPHPRERYNHK